MVVWRKGIGLQIIFHNMVHGLQYHIAKNLVNYTVCSMVLSTTVCTVQKTESTV